MNRETLIATIEEHAVSTGEFVLASGAKSNFYLDCRKLMLHREHLRLVTGAFLSLTRGLDFDALGGPATAVLPLAGCWIGMRDLPCRGFYLRKEAKQHGKSDLLVADLKPMSQCVVVDDVCTSGGSMLKTVDALEEAGHRVVFATCIVDREAGATDAFHARDIPFKPLVKLSDLPKLQRFLETAAQ